jgi:hypothetical protein
MTIAFVIGNGISRKDIDLLELQKLGKIYGCNALHREFTPDVLVSTDRPISAHIQESGYSAKNKFYTRRPIAGLGAHTVPKDYFGYSSGPIATAIAAQDQHRRIYLLGFDMGPTTTQTFNNLYAGTEFYKPMGATPTYTGNWIKQISRVIADHPRTRFFRICGPTTARIPELESLKNLDHWELSAFAERINNQKDL